MQVSHTTKGEFKFGENLVCNLNRILHYNINTFIVLCVCYCCYEFYADSVDYVNTRYSDTRLIKNAHSLRRDFIWSIRNS